MNLYIKAIRLIMVTSLLLLFLPKSADAETGAPRVSASAAILMEQESGRILYAKNEHQTMRIASITKIMTAILAIESGKLNSKVKVSEEAVRTEGSTLFLKPGEVISLKDLVYGLMLRSGNDAAVAIAENVGGSLDGFVYLMNEKAKQIGMKNTQFQNPHGLDDHDDLYSTAYDMALLTRYAMNNPTFREISATKEYRSHQEGEKWDVIWRNKNKMLKYYPYSTGGKTGYTKMAKRTLVSTAKKGGMDLIVVTLNDSNDWEDHQSLFEWGYKNYHLVPLVEKGTVVGINDPFYKNKVKANRTFFYPLTSDENKEIERNITLYKPPKKKEWQSGQIPRPVGMITLQLSGTPIGELPLFYEGNEPKKEAQGIWESFLHFLVQLFVISQGGN